MSVRRSSPLAARALALLALLTAALSTGAPARAQVEAPKATPATAPAAATQPVQVTIGYQIFEIRDVKIKDEHFVADFYMWMNYTCADEALAKEIETFEFMNGKLDVREEIDRETNGADRYVCWRMTGGFYLNTDLRNYPFDTQRFDITIEHPSLEIDKVVYRDDHSSYSRSKVPQELWGVKPELKIPEFRLKQTERRSIGSIYDTDFGKRSSPAKETVYSRFVMSIYFGRDYMAYVFKIVFPLLVIVAMAYVALLLPPQEIQSASGLEITALLSTIAFNMTVSQNLPEVGYLVVSDKFFIVTYIILFLTLIQSVLAYVWLDQDREAFARRWLKGCRWVFPVLDLAAFIFLGVQAAAVI